VWWAVALKGVAAPLAWGPVCSSAPEEKDSATSSPWLVSSFPAVESVRSVFPLS
jgi:hypothetical protein